MSSRFVFFGTGANFSLAVFEQLIALDQLPLAVVVPEYPAYQFDLTDSLQIQQPVTSNQLISLAKNLYLPLIYSPDKLASKLVNQLSIKSFDFILVACWPYKLTEAVCEQAAKAALNLHPSLLPAYRGLDPVGEQISQRERDLGVSLHLLSDEFDSGDIVKNAKLEQPIELSRNFIEQRAAIKGVELFIEASEGFGGSEWNPRSQNIS